MEHPAFTPNSIKVKKKKYWFAIPTEARYSSPSLPIITVSIRLSSDTIRFCTIIGIVSIITLL